MTKPFTDYLEALFHNDYPMMLDDDIPDAYEAWICNQDLENLGDKYITQLLNNTTIHTREKEDLINQTLRDLT